MVNEIILRDDNITYITDVLTGIQSRNVHFWSGDIFKQIRYVVWGDILKLFHYGILLCGFESYKYTLLKFWMGNVTRGDQWVFEKVDMFFEGATPQKH